MSVPAPAPITPGAVLRDAPRGSAVGLALREASLGDRIALAAFGVISLLAAIGPSIAPDDPGTPVAPAFQAPSWSHPMGTDDVGRDMFSRVLAGIPSTWLSALAVIALATLIGAVVGTLAATAGGWIEAVLMRITDAFLAFPAPLVAIAVIAALGPSLLHTLIAVSILWWPYYARIVRAEVRALLVRPNVDAARMSGISRRRLILRHVVPGAVPITVVAASLDIGGLITVLAALSFLGLGAPAPSPELGAMTARGASSLLTAWWVPVMPGLAVFALALVGNWAGDAVHDMLDRR